LTLTGWLTLRRASATVTAPPFTFTTTVWVIYWVHHATTNSWPNTHFASAASFTDYHLSVLSIGNLAY
jgi:hypothetical protein